MDVRITDKGTSALIGSITRDEFKFLVDQLEEESSTDTDYFIDLATVDILEAAGGSADLVALLRNAVGTSDGIDITWEYT